MRAYSEGSAPPSRWLASGQASSDGLRGGPGVRLAGEVAAELNAVVAFGAEVGGVEQPGT
jgi:hypothetical protein